MMVLQENDLPRVSLDTFVYVHHKKEIGIPLGYHLVCREAVKNKP